MAGLTGLSDVSSIVFYLLQVPKLNTTTSLLCFHTVQTFVGAQGRKEGDRYYCKLIDFLISSDTDSLIFLLPAARFPALHPTFPRRYFAATKDYLAAPRTTDHRRITGVLRPRARAVPIDRVSTLLSLSFGETELLHRCRLGYDGETTEMSQNEQELVRPPALPSFQKSRYLTRVSLSFQPRSVLLCGCLASKRW